MNTLPRLYDRVISEHLSQNRQMLFLSGPRQVGKTTTGRGVGAGWPEYRYLNWDNLSDRRVILEGPDRVAAAAGVDRLREGPVLLVLDEVHKYEGWKGFLKGLFDSYEADLRILVTGSARLEVFGAGGESLMGRYFPCRMHPLSVAEVTAPEPSPEPIRPEPRKISDADWEVLLRFGGFPEPFVRREDRFFLRWRRLRSRQLLQEELRDLTRIQDLDRLAVLAELVRERAGSLTSAATLGRQLRVTIPTVQRWLAALAALYYCYPIRPWHRNVRRALRKEPKYYLWDWSLVKDPGARFENLVASALLKAVHCWTDGGLGEFGLHFVRDKEGREVDFLISRDGEAWILVEAKSSGSAPLSAALHRFQGQTGVSHAFQVARDLPFVERNCFEVDRPMIVPARTFLAQLA